MTVCIRQARRGFWGALDSPVLCGLEKVRYNALWTLVEKQHEAVLRVDRLDRVLVPDDDAGHEIAQSVQVLVLGRVLRRSFHLHSSPVLLSLGAMC